MNYYIGIDLGTSALKGLLVAADGKIVREASESYPVYNPRDGWSEQNPDDWLSAAKKVIARLKDGLEESIKGLSFGGQMHGLVILDSEDRVIRPAILWNDGRSDKQTEYLNSVIGKEKLASCTANIAFAGFTAPKILWLKENEPQSYSRIDKIMLPKDYLAYRLTGVFSTDYSDASGTLLLDVQNKCWSKDMCEICCVKREWLPTLYESFEVTGKVLPQYGLPAAEVAAGAGDNAAAAFGMGTIRNGDCNISIGTSGTVFIACDTFSSDSKYALHSFCNATGKWHLMGCILSAASCRKWWLEDVLNTTDYASDDLAISEADADGVIFLPYLTGERSPHNDVNVRGAFIGLNRSTTRAQMSRAVQEGVAFALRDCLEAAKENGFAPTCATVCGGGAVSRVWCGILSDILGIPIRIKKTEQGPAYGAALLAMVGTEEIKFEDVADMTEIKSEIYPDKARFEIYNEKYKTYKKLYPLIKQL